MGKVETWTDGNGVFRMKGIVLFIIVTPEGYPIYPTMRRKMKDACMAFEGMEGEDWDHIQPKGFRVMKLFAGGYDRTDQSLISINDWVVDIGGEYAD